MIDSLRRREDYRTHTWHTRNRDSSWRAASKCRNAVHKISYVFYERRRVNSYRNNCAPRGGCAKVGDRGHGRRARRTAEVHGRDGVAGGCSRRRTRERRETGRVARDPRAEAVGSEGRRYIRTNRGLPWARAGERTGEQAGRDDSEV